MLYTVSFLLNGVLTQLRNMRRQLLKREYLPVVVVTTVIAIAIATAVTVQSQLSVCKEFGVHRARAIQLHNA